MSTTALIPERVHLVGVGGAHMSAIARMLLARGHTVSGSDQRATPLTTELSALGLAFNEGHAAANLQDPGLVVYTAAATQANPELTAARRAGVEVISRAQMVARLVSGLKVIAVAGTHGKTTTTSLVAYLLQRCGLSPTYLVGGEPLDLGASAGAGNGDWAVVEADEYARAFLEYEPDIAIVTNVEADHLDYYGDYESVKAAFAQFIERVRPGGLIIAATGSEGLDEVLEAARPAARILRYGANGASTWKGYKVQDVDGLQSFSLMGEGSDLGRFSTRLPGVHNVWNAVGAIAAARHAGCEDLDLMKRELPFFKGTKRRFELVGEAGAISVYDDYSHHPTEIRAAVAGARSRFPGRRLVLLFQPHTYSRTHYLLDQFLTAFAGVDSLFILETYAAREAIAEGMDAGTLAGRMTSPPAVYLPSPGEAIMRLATELRAGDVFFTMGAGDVDSVGRDLLAALKARTS